MRRIIAFLSMLFVFNIISAYPGKIVKSFDTPGKFSTGLTYDGKFLWVADRQTDLIYKINPSNGKVVKTIKAPAFWIVGLAWDGKYLWAVDFKGALPKAENYHGVLYKIDPENGTVLHTVELPIIKPQDITFDGTYIWIVDDYTNTLIQLDQNDGTTIGTIPAPATSPTGLTFDGEYLWVSDRGRNKIYMVEPTTGRVIITTDSPDEFPRGLAFDGTYLWNSDSQADKIFKLIRKDNEKMIKKNELDNVKLTYTHQVTNFGFGNIKTLDIHIAIPENRDNQQIVKIEYSPKPEIVKDRWGQKTAHFHYENIPPDSSVAPQMTVYAKLWDVTYFIFPDEVGTIDQIPEETKIYLENANKYMYDHPVIQNAVAAAVGDEKNVYWIVRNIFDYVREHMYYEMAGGWNTAPTVLARGNGSCSEYSFVFIAMCRAAGVPARYVGAVAQRGEYSSTDDIFHRWVEVYMPNYGWIPVDPSGGDSDLPANQARGFGHVSNGYIITTQNGGGSKTMGWTYNSNYFYTADPQTFVVSENFGDWDIKP